MIKTKICDNCGEELGRIKLDDLYKYNWTAFQIPAGKGKVYCFCPKKGCQKSMIKKIQTKIRR